MSVRISKNSYNGKYTPYLLALVFTLMILGIHLLPNMDSMLNENNTKISHVFLKSQIDYHKEIAPFARRPLTTLLIESTISSLSLRPGHAFILVNFFLLFVSGVLMYKLSSMLKATPIQALFNMAIYFSSFSVLFAFYPPVFSYDEPLQYCFILTALMAYVRQKWGLYILLFTLSLISRETSLLLLPALLLFAPGLTNAESGFSVKTIYKRYVLIIIPLMLYACYIALFISKNNQFEATQTELASRFGCFLENFESAKNTIESLTSIFLTLGPFMVLTLFPLKSRRTILKNAFVKSFLLTAAIN
ncbi:MAG: hypothetical protein HKN31_09775, partial [Pricia sp.]|nr:hypothetical protein [Pricia sp.]